MQLKKYDFFAFLIYLGSFTYYPETTCFITSDCSKISFPHTQLNSFKFEFRVCQFNSQGNNLLSKSNPEFIRMADHNSIGTRLLYLEDIEESLIQTENLGSASYAYQYTLFGKL